MKTLTIFILSFALILSTKSSNNFEDIFGDDYTNAQNFLATQQAEFTKVCGTASEAKILKAVVFPELLRYSMFRNIFETKFLEVLYVKHGTEGADFSIGRFQMKPSFAETIERHIKVFPNAAAFKYKATAKNEIRAERICRLSDTEWQIQYLNAFYQILEKRWGEEFPQSVNEQVLLLATAYNRGMLNTPTTLKKHYKLKAFPYGNSYLGEQYSYAEIALDYFKKSSN